ncbi:MAG: alkaline phosphatase D family protein [Pirellulaceae bacterium]
MPSSKSKFQRRDFLKKSAVATASTALVAPSIGAQENATQSTAHAFDFPNVDSLVHPNGWQTLNPGYWQVKAGALRRRLTNVGDRARRTGFPFHAMSKGGTMETQYDPSLPAGMIYRSDVRLMGSFKITATLTFRGDRPEPADGDDPKWMMYQDGYGQMGIVLGANSVMESFDKTRSTTQMVWNDAGKLQVIKPGKRQAPVVSDNAMHLSDGDVVTLTVAVQQKGDNATVRVDFQQDGQAAITLKTNMAANATEGFAGVVGRGLIDFEVNGFVVEGTEITKSEPSPFDCYVCYPLGDTLTKNDGGDWTVRFVGIFHSDGEVAEIRVADSPSPDGGWQSVPVAGKAKIVSNDFRRNTSVVDVALPANPADKTMYYTVWKDGENVTADSRIGSHEVGPGTGLVGDVPASGEYVGRLPRLQAPYKLCGLSCHAITSGLQVKTENGYRITGGGAEWQFRDQPSEGSYQHLDDYKFQVMVWEDDVWYMELVMYPPSTDDAYKIVNQSICGPTSRWQMMRHWNVINPGDHDYGMDDVKGPEQLVIRRVPGLGQDINYMQRNFQIVHHLTTGAEQVDPLENPKKWRAWKMPNRDFTFVILDSRLWRSSQNTDIWDDSGWDNFKSLYDRTDPTRSLLGEEQFAWLQQLVTTDASRLICLTGINGMHTIWTGGTGQSESNDHPMKFSQRDRVTADYAGWVKAGADRVLELLGSRDGIVTVYGDVHNGCIMKNTQHRIIECSFGPIGRSGGRGVIPGFGPKMNDVDGREVEVSSLYHKDFADANLNPHPKHAPFYWNFLEMEFDPQKADPQIGLRVRNLVDSPKDTPRGGGHLQTTASATGRQFPAVVKDQSTIANADVRFMTLGGRPIRATRSFSDGKVPDVGLESVEVGDEVLMVVTDGTRTASKIVSTSKR